MEIIGIAAYGTQSLMVTLFGCLSQYLLAVLLPPPRRICNRRCVCLSVSNFAENFRMDLHEIFREGWHWANEQTIKFWWQSGSRIQIMTLVRRALAEVCIVPVLLVS